MKTVITIVAFLASLAMTGVLSSASGQSATSRTAHYQETYMLLCLDHKLTNPNFDISVSPVFDWVHAGQEGLQVTVTNKTNENLIVNWPEAAVFGENVGGVEASSVVPPETIYTETLWPRTGVMSTGSFQHPDIRVSFQTRKGADRHDVILVNAPRNGEVCSA
jgi:hypothetical protein